MNPLSSTSRLVETESKALLDILGSVVDGRGATYMSVPITTGRRFVEWSRYSATYQSPGTQGDDEYRRQVVQPNRLAARELVLSLRNSLTEPVIDPTALGEIPGWTQTDYHALWAMVLKRFAARVILGDGWEYSRGCAFEYLTAMQTNIPAFDADMRPIALECGIAALKSAISHIQALGQDTSFLDQVLQNLLELG